MNQKLTFAGWPVEYVGTHESPRYIRVRYTGEPSVNFGTPCPPADHPYRSSVRAGMVFGARRDAVMVTTN